MQALQTCKGIVAPLDALNVDTDQIIPKQFLKRIERTGYGQFLFFDWRYFQDETENPDFILNQEPYRNAKILLGRDNFGCGSSREHAPWALSDFGFRVIIAPSFADIFYNNSFKNGILLIKLDKEIVDALFEEAAQTLPYELEVDLPKQIIRKPDGSEIAFEIDEFRKMLLLEGLDDIGLTLQYESDITVFEQQHQTFLGSFSV